MNTISTKKLSKVQTEDSIQFIYNNSHVILCLPLDTPDDLVDSFLHVWYKGYILGIAQGWASENRKE